MSTFGDCYVDNNDKGDGDDEAPHAQDFFFLCAAGRKNVHIFILHEEVWEGGTCKEDD